MVRLAHLSDVHIPWGLTTHWLTRWKDTAARILEWQPDVVLLTGDFLRWSFPEQHARRRLSWFVNEVAPQTLGSAHRIFVPGARDLRATGNVDPQDALHATLFQQGTRLITGWSDAVANVHVHAFDASEAAHLIDSSSGFVGRISIPAGCADLDHLHIFALHSRPDSANGILESDSLFSLLAKRGYDIVLGAQPHNPDFGVPVAQRRADGLWLTSAPSATAQHRQGFNLFHVDMFGSFKLSTVMRAEGKWHRPYLIASRDYEEARTRRWREQREQGLSADVIDVNITNYASGSDYEQRMQERCGDIAVTMIVHQPRTPNPEVHQDIRLPLPAAPIAGYNGAAWRAIQAGIVGGPLLMINDDGTMTLPANETRDIEISGVLLNALPSGPGDWKRMCASSEGRPFDLFSIEPRMAARFLRIRVDCPRVKPLSVTARRHGSVVADENAFYTTRDDRLLGRQEFMIVRPVIGIGYALADVLDPLIDTQTSKQPARVMQWQRTIAELSKSSFPASVHTSINRALDTLRRQIIDVASHLQPHLLDHDDIAVDLLSIHRGLEVVMTDSVNGKRKEHRRNALGIGFAWGQGVAGRALRLTAEYSWSRTERSGPEGTLPADNWYHRHADISVHAHVYCRPVITSERGRSYAIAMLSFATHRADSGLADVIRQLQDRTDTLDARSVCDRAVKVFENALDHELRNYHHEIGDDDDATD
jgi:hypothetical protein